MIENCHIHGIDSSGIVLESCLDTRVQDCVIEDLIDSPGHEGYGILLSDACESVVITGNRIRRVRHGVDTGRWQGARLEQLPDGTNITAGAPRGTVVSKNVISRCTNAAISWHAHSAGVTVVGNVISDTLGFGIFCRGPSSYIQGNSIEWAGGGISVGADSDDAGRIGTRRMGSGTQILGNVIRHTGNFADRRLNSPGAPEVQGSADGGDGVGIELHSADYVIVAGNALSDCEGASVRLRGGTRRCVVVDNVLTDVAHSQEAGAAILLEGRNDIEHEVDGTIVDLTSRGNLIRNNVIYDTSPEGERSEGGRATYGIDDATLGSHMTNGNRVHDNVAANMTGGAVFRDVTPAPDGQERNFHYDN